MMSPSEPSQSSPDPDEKPAEAPAIRVLKSEELFAGASVVIIEHAGSYYRLQITARGRLILQK